MSLGDTCLLPRWCPAWNCASLVRALVRNVGTCDPIRRVHLACATRPRERDPQAEDTARGRVAMRAAGADRPVVAMMPSNAGGAKGAAHPGLVDGQLPAVGGAGERAEADGEVVL